MTSSHAAYKERCEKKVIDARIARLQEKVDSMVGEIYGLEAKLRRAKALLKDNDIDVEL